LDVARGLEVDPGKTGEGGADVRVERTGCGRIVRVDPVPVFPRMMSWGSM
jgi:hypothetical protein